MEPPAKRARLEEETRQDAELLTSTTTIDDIPDGLLAEIFHYFHLIERRKRRRVSARWSTVLRSRALMTQVAIDVDPRFTRSFERILRNPNRQNLIDSDKMEVVLFYSSAERKAVGEATPQARRTLLDRNLDVHRNTNTCSLILGLWPPSSGCRPSKVLVGRMDISVCHVISAVRGTVLSDAEAPMLYVQNIRIPALDHNDYRLLMDVSHYFSENLRCATMVDIPACEKLDLPQRQGRDLDFFGECNEAEWTMVKKHMAPLTTTQSATLQQRLEDCLTDSKESGIREYILKKTFARLYPKKFGAELDGGITNEHYVSLIMGDSEVAFVAYWFIEWLYVRNQSF